MGTIEKIHFTYNGQEHAVDEDDALKEFNYSLRIVYANRWVHLGDISRDPATGKKWAHSVPRIMRVPNSHRIGIHEEE